MSSAVPSATLSASAWVLKMPWVTGSGAGSPRGGVCSGGGLVGAGVDGLFTTVSPGGAGSSGGRARSQRGARLPREGGATRSTPWHLPWGRLCGLCAPRVRLGWTELLVSGGLATSKAPTDFAAYRLAQGVNVGRWARDSPPGVRYPAPARRFFLSLRPLAPADSEKVGSGVGAGRAGGGSRSAGRSTGASAGSAGRRMTKVLPSPTRLWTTSSRRGS